MAKSSYVINITGRFDAETMRDALDAEYGAALLAHDLVTKLAHVTHASFGGAHYVAPNLFELPKPPTDHRRLPPGGGGAPQGPDGVMTPNPDVA